ncbi:MAG TPA: hypothetical protein VEK11_16650 [Thermoanaerobaculia bacterium]|nr:hypothetical protein [Thermoanaerobaculia bacterium]
MYCVVGGELADFVHQLGNNVRITAGLLGWRQDRIDSDLSDTVGDDAYSGKQIVGDTEELLNIGSRGRSRSRDDAFTEWHFCDTEERGHFLNKYYRHVLAPLERGQLLSTYSSSPRGVLLSKPFLATLLSKQQSELLEWRCYFLAVVHTPP